MKCNRYGIMIRLLGCTVLLLGAVSVFAADTKDGVVDGPGDPIIAANCDLTGYKSEVQVLSPPTAVPDNNPAGVVVGPIVVADDGTTIADVVIDVSISHTWIGDLVLQVRYDEDNNGTDDVTSNIVCRPGGTTCGPTGTLGCSSNFVCNNQTPYLFDDTALVSLPTAGCTSTANVPPGCYKPTGTGAGTLAVFAGHRKGGRWTLFAQDNAGADTGTICQWSVHIKNATVATEPKSWGNVKVLYSGD
jgi:subtilisin-like proprotein convertase family protein